MSGISAMGTTYNLPNYNGELFSLSPAATPLLSAIGGLTGGLQSDATEFEWQVYDLATRSQPATLEGAAAPTAEGRVRANVRNVCQIHQKKVSVSYTKQAATGRLATPSAAPYVTASAAGASPVISELDWQVEQAIKEIAGDVNYSFIRGHYVLPTTGAAARRTKGLLEAITTNVTDKGTNVATGASSATDTVTPAAAHSFAAGDLIVFDAVGAATNITVGEIYYIYSVSTTVSFKVKTTSGTSGGTALTLGTSSADLSYHQAWTTTLTTDHIETAIQGVWDNGGLRGGVPVLLVNSRQKRAVSAAYATSYGKANPLINGNTVGGVPVQTILTDFGELGIMLESDMPKDSIGFISLDMLAPVFLNTPGKGVFFEEALAKTGASDDVQLYGEIGLKFGNEKAHGILRGLAI
jgi:hypothetical protein